MKKRYHVDVYLPDELGEEFLGFIPRKGTRLWLGWHYKNIMEDKELPEYLVWPCTSSLVDITTSSGGRIENVKLRWYVPCKDKDITVMISGNKDVGYTALSAYWLDKDDVHASLDVSKYEQGEMM